MIVKDLEINNYKGISNLRFNPTKINIIVGKNNTCKTSILTAIDLLFNNERIKRKNIQSFFNIYSNKKLIKISANVDNIEEDIEVREAEEVEAVTSFSKELVKILLYNLVKQSDKLEFKDVAVKEIEKIVEKNIDEELRSLILKNSVVLTNKKDGAKVYSWLKGYTSFEKIEKLLDNVSTYIEKLSPENQKDEYKTFLRNAYRYTLFSITRGMLDMSVVNNEKKKNTIYIESPMSSEIDFSERLPEDTERIHEIEKLVKENKLIHNLVRLNLDNVLFSTENGEKAHPFELLGQGFQSIIGFLWQLSSNKIKNKIILIDEPETHLHRGYIKELIKFLVEFSKKLDIQFFITTHSSDVLDIFLSDELEKGEQDYLNRELSVLRIDKIKDSITLAENLDYKSAKEAIENLLLDLRGV